jgi:hypothetical protein
MKENRISCVSLALVSRSCFPPFLSLTISQHSPVPRCLAPDPRRALHPLEAFPPCPILKGGLQPSSGRVVLYSWLVSHMRVASLAAPEPSIFLFLLHFCSSCFCTCTRWKANYVRFCREQSIYLLANDFLSFFSLFFLTIAALCWAELS